MPLKPFLRKHRRWVLGGIVFVVLLLLAAAITLGILSSQLTPYVEGAEFREELNKQTSKGLHFEGKYGTISRTGTETVAADEFHAVQGVKAMKSLDASGITAKFNASGVFRRRWQLDYIHIKRGEVEIQTYEPKPDNKAPKPWYAIFLPDHVYLCEVNCDTANVKWQMQKKPAGIFDTQIRITPYGRDFEYFAKGGTMRTGGMTPDFKVEAIHLLITKKILKVYQLELVPKGAEKASIKLTGEMGMRDDKHVDMELKFDNLPIAPWLPDDLAGEIHGVADGSVHWTGTEQTLEGSSGDGEVRVNGGELKGLPLLEFLATATARKSLKEVTLSQCVVKFRWNYPRFEIVSLDLAAEEKVKLRGSLVLQKGELSGEVDLGMAPTYLDWLPRAKEEIFTREEDGLIWTKVRISGTLKEPVDDLTPRLAETLKKSPAAATALLLRETGEWLEQKLKGKKKSEEPDSSKPSTRER